MIIITRWQPHPHLSSIYSSPQQTWHHTLASIPIAATPAHITVWYSLRTALWRHQAAILKMDLQIW